MFDAREPESVRTLCAIARRVANGEEIVPSEVGEVLDTIGPTSERFHVGRALRCLSRREAIDEESDRRRLFHAARALAERLHFEATRPAGPSLAKRVAREPLERSA